MRSTNRGIRADCERFISHKDLGRKKHGEKLNRSKTAMEPDSPLGVAERAIAMAGRKGSGWNATIKPWYQYQSLDSNGWAEGQRLERLRCGLTA
jgi:hypothetical protein